MKKLLILAGMLAIALQGPACVTGDDSENSSVISAEAQPVEVFYFHYSRRCATCVAVEEVSEAALKKFYPEKLKNGEMIFLSVNLEEKEGKDLGRKHKVAGQSLVIIYGKEKVDLTNSAFMNARTNPEKLEQEIKAEIDKLLGS